MIKIQFQLPGDFAARAARATEADITFTPIFILPRQISAKLFFFPVEQLVPSRLKAFAATTKMPGLRNVHLKRKWGRNDPRRDAAAETSR